MPDSFGRRTPERGTRDAISTNWEAPATYEILCRPAVQDLSVDLPDGDFRPLGQCNARQGDEAHRRNEHGDAG